MNSSSEKETSSTPVLRLPVLLLKVPESPAVCVGLPVPSTMSLLKTGKLKLHVIGDGIPTGICGSGLLDLVACLLDLGIISKRGRLEKPAKWPDELKETYGVRFVTRNNVSALLLTDDENGIYLSQKDIREVQLAKAAIASGIELLCQEMNVSDTDISQVLLAGALRHLPFSKGVPAGSD